MQSAIDLDGCRLLSQLPGRERWQIPALLRQPQVVAQVESRLANEPGVLAASANPVSGRLLILYEPRLAAEAVARMVRAALLAALGFASSSAASNEPAEEPAEEPGLTAAEVAGGAALVVGAVAAAKLALGAAAGAFSLPVLLGAGAVATLVTGILARRRAAASLPAALTQRLLARNRARSHPLGRLLRYAGEYRPQVYLAGACSILKKVFDLCEPLLIGLAVNVVTRQGGSLLAGLGFASVSTQLGVLAGLTAVVWTLESVFDYGQRTLWRDLSQKVQHKLRCEAYAHVQHVELGYLEDQSTGDLAAALNDNINQIETFLNEGADSLLQLTTNMVIVAGIFFLVGPQVAWINFLPLPVVVGTIYYYHKRVSPLYAEAEERAAAVNTRLVNNVTGMTTIRSFTNEERESLAVEGLSQDYFDSNRKAFLFASALNPVVRIVVMAGFAGTLLLGGKHVLAGTLAPGSYALLLFLTQRFLFPFVNMGNTLEQFHKTMASVERAFELLDAPVGPPDGRLPLPSGSVRGEVVFDRVDFSYTPEKLVLRDFSLCLPAGETTAVVGTTGAGKTSLVKLLLRFYDVSSGHIRVDGNDIRDLRLSDLRGAIGLVSQDVFLFAGTVRENIAYAKPGASMAEIVEAARLAEADGFIRKLPKGYDTQIGEQGLKLSGGQRQRLCLARAVLKDPPILILDEATSAVDNETEAAIQRSLDRISVNRTTLIIAHRLSTVRNAHQIYVLSEEGKVVEQGDHATLVSRNGFYNSLWRVQTGAGRREAARKSRRSA
jgi:ATP-binding cassette, subfamily B, bacterial